MRFIGNIIEKLQRHPKRIVFPEGTEPRVLQAARQFFSLRLGVPILLGDRTKVKELAEELNISLEGLRVINPAESGDLDNFARRFAAIRRFKGLKAPEAREAILQPNYFGAMMLAMHQADGLVSGTSHTTGSVLRPLFQIIKMAPQAITASSCMILEVEDSRFGENGVLFMADCGVVPSRMRTSLPISRFPRPGSHASCWASGHALPCSPSPRKAAQRIPRWAGFQAATALAQQKAEAKGLDADFDGELQVDAALVPDIANRKLPESKVAGHANVLIFPELNSGNIASKLARHMARANAYGQILLGLDRPAADVSRGSNAHDILGVAAIVGVQAVDYAKFYPGAGEKLPGE